MEDDLFTYFNKLSKKSNFFINNLVSDLNIPEPILSKKIEKLIMEHPNIGSYNRKTG